MHTEPAEVCEGECRMLQCVIMATGREPNGLGEADEGFRRIASPKP